MPTALNKRILVLPSWYPSRVHAFNGDFIQRHIGAISLYCQQDVFFVIKDEKSIVTKDVLREEKITGNCKEVIIYYHVKKTGIALLDKLISQRKYENLYKKAINDYLKKEGLPDLVHVQIAMKAGLIALWIKKKWNIPFVLSEQWTAYLPEADLRINDFPALYNKLLKRIIAGANSLSVVSDYLGNAIQKNFGKPFTIIPNVVDTTIFFPADKTATATLKLAHVSNMNYQKNIDAIINAAVYLKDKNIDFEILLFGPASNDLQQSVNEKGLHKNIFFKGEVAQKEIAAELRQSDALIIYSRFETFGCVLIEANASGIPVIASGIKVFHEIIEEGVNGIFVEGGNAEALGKKLLEFSSKKNTFNQKQIALDAAAKYNYEKVGGQFMEFYQNALAINQHT